MIDPDAQAFADAYAADPTDDDTLDHLAARMAAGEEDGMDDLLEVLAERSHIGWMQEKQAQGFADHVWPSDWTVGVKHAETCPVPISRHHADMLPYSDLSEATKEYDRAPVRCVLVGIRQAEHTVIACSELRALQEAVALLNSMVLSGESHSDASRAAVRAALDAR